MKARAGQHFLEGVFSVFLFAKHKTSSLSFLFSGFVLANLIIFLNVGAQQYVFNLVRLGEYPFLVFAKQVNSSLRAL